ncbi:MAG: LAGLIDADG family homing endonuclease [Candidatus Pacebacteria bacterium]|nr:LAGLIDADG family homing endonuclease [Candidatus Paceibacterota bacterium]
MPVFKRVNKDFFKKWAPEMAYVLGFFAADGYITLNKRSAHFWCIQITDKLLLEAIKEAVGSEHAISVRKRSGNENTIYRLQIGSKEMCDDLRHLGMKERKTKSMTIPHVPEKYFSHFVRGYFDGDGNVWVGRVKKRNGASNLAIITMFTSCSFEFLERLHLRLAKSDVKGGSIYKAKQGYARLQLSVNDSLKLYDLMYNQPASSIGSLFLERKKRVFEKYILLRG